MNLNRRTFLEGVGAAVATTACGVHLSPYAFADTTTLQSASPGGTTLESVTVPGSTVRGSYRRLTLGDGWPTIVRSELAQPRSGRDLRRTELSSLVQFTDVHIVDAQSPVRVEYLHPFIGSAFRPHEALGVNGAISLVQRVNSLQRGPIGGRKFDCLVSTGDNTDNHETVELDWFLTVMSGGTVTPNTGDPTRWEGVQAWNSHLYWQPDTEIHDNYKAVGFPQLPGFLQSAMKPAASPGLDVPWYSVFGNHDDSICGTAPSGIAGWLYTGRLKLDGLASYPDTEMLADAFAHNPKEVPTLLNRFTVDGPAHLVTPDDRRAPFSIKHYLQAHFDPRHTGSGPVGHGFDADAPITGTTYYSFLIAPGVVGISLDSTNHAGFVDGSINQTQLDWVEKKLIEGSSRYYDHSGTLVTSLGKDDTLFVLFSHHTSTTMGNTVPAEDSFFEYRHTGPQFVKFLKRFPNVVAWINGHTHENRITSHQGPTPSQSFWEINTASHIDYPQMARIIEIFDNKDGTISLFTPLIEADSPVAVSHDSVESLDHSGLASLYRELSYNDIHRNDKLMGSIMDHNTELLLARP